MISDMLERVRERRPLIHCITNTVTINDCANIVLASGASPIMASAPEEVEEITELAAATVINIGTPSAERVKAMRLAGKKANELGHPVVLDPVGAGASRFRRAFLGELLREVRFTVIRGNLSEIRTLAYGSGAQRGVDADLGAVIGRENAADAAEFARRLAEQMDTVIVISGEVDIVADKEKAYSVENGSAMARLVTGSGCMLSALTGAFEAANPEDPLTAALAAVCMMDLAQETAEARLTPKEGNASFRNYVIDAVCRMNSGRLSAGANLREW